MPTEMADWHSTLVNLNVFLAFASIAGVFYYIKYVRHLVPSEVTLKREERAASSRAIAPAGADALEQDETGLPDKGQLAQTDELRERNRIPNPIDGLMGCFDGIPMCTAQDDEPSSLQEEIVTETGEIVTSEPASTEVEVNIIEKPAIDKDDEQPMPTGAVSNQSRPHKIKILALLGLTEDETLKQVTKDFVVDGSDKASAILRLISALALIKLGINLSIGIEWGALGVMFAWLTRSVTLDVEIDGVPDQALLVLSFIGSLSFSLSLYTRFVQLKEICERKVQDLEDIKPFETNVRYFGKGYIVFINSILSSDDLYEPPRGEDCGADPPPLKGKRQQLIEEVTIPEGKDPGCVLLVTTPHGQYIRVRVPEGSSPGMVLKIPYVRQWWTYHTFQQFLLRLACFTGVMSVILFFYSAGTSSGVVDRIAGVAMMFSVTPLLWRYIISTARRSFATFCEDDKVYYWQTAARFEGEIVLFAFFVTYACVINKMIQFGKAENYWLLLTSYTFAPICVLTHLCWEANAASASPTPGPEEAAHLFKETHPKTVAEIIRWYTCFSKSCAYQLLERFLVCLFTTVKWLVPTTCWPHKRLKTPALVQAGLKPRRKSMIDMSGAFGESLIRDVRYWWFTPFMLFESAAYSWMTLVHGKRRVCLVYGLDIAILFLIFAIAVRPFKSRGVRATDIAIRVCNIITMYIGVRIHDDGPSGGAWGLLVFVNVPLLLWLGLLIKPIRYIRFTYHLVKSAAQSLKKNK